MRKLTRLPNHLPNFRAVTRRPRRLCHLTRHLALLLAGVLVVATLIVFKDSWTREWPVSSSPSSSAHRDWFPDLSIDENEGLINNGTISLEWNDFWTENFVSIEHINDVKSSMDHVREIQSNSSEAVHSEPWRMGYRLSEEERLLTVKDIDQLLVHLKVTWPVTIYEPGRENTLISLETLRDCLLDNTCRPEATTVIMGAIGHYGNALHGKMSGEDIWARSSIDAFVALGHTVVYSYETLEMFAIYQAIGHLVPIILASGSSIKECAGLGIPKLLSDGDLRDGYGSQVLHHDELYARFSELGMKIPDNFDRDKQQSWGWRIPRDWTGDHPVQYCIKTKTFEDGIPIWKLAAMHFWGGPSHPLGRAWTMAPEHYASHPGARGSRAQNFYLGYSVIKHIRQFNHTSHAARRNAGFVFAKNIFYFDKEHSAFWNDDHTFADLKQDMGVDFVSVAGSSADILPDKGLSNHGRLPMSEFYQLLGSTRFMVGIGSPTLSPTPYDALALGVPFINPILKWDENDPADVERWNCQQNALVHIKPPYVYHVHAHDLAALKRAMESALDHPIDEYTPPHMTERANWSRHKDLVNLNWQSLARRRLDLLSSQGQDTYFAL